MTKSDLMGVSFGQVAVPAGQRLGVNPNEPFSYFPGEKSSTILWGEDGVRIYTNDPEAPRNSRYELVTHEQLQEIFDHADSRLYQIQERPVQNYDANGQPRGRTQCRVSFLFRVEGMGVDVDAKALGAIVLHSTARPRTVREAGPEWENPLVHLGKQGESVGS